MPDIQFKDFRGLYSAGNPFSDEPAADFNTFDNVIIRQKGIVEPRRGFSSAGGDANVPTSMLFRGSGYAILHRNSSGNFWVYKAGTTDQASAVGPGATYSFGFLTAPTWAWSNELPLLQINQNTYAATQYGLFKLESPTGTWRSCSFSPTPVSSWDGGTGVPVAPYQMGQYLVVAYAAADTTPANHWLATGNKVGYRIQIGRKGANNDVVYGPPSDTIICGNSTGGATGVALNPTNGWMWTDDCFVRIWRTTQVASASDLPQDYYLLKEISPMLPPNASATIDGYLNPQITSPDATRVFYDGTGDTALTGNPPAPWSLNAGDTLAVAPWIPPAASTMAYFKGVLYLGNVSYAQQYTLRLLGTGTGGQGVGDSITIDNFKWTWTTPPGSNYLSGGLGNPALWTALGTAGLNVEQTARNFVNGINNRSQVLWNGASTLGTLQNLLVAQYTSLGASDLGTMVISRLIPGAPAFSVSASNGYGWGQNFILTQTSDPNRQVAGLANSLDNQPEMFPQANLTIVGDAGKPIIKLLSTKDSLWIFKDQDGLWRLSNDNGTISIVQFDPTVQLVGPAVVCNNEVYALCADGFQRINEQGREKLSRPFETELLSRLAYCGTNVATVGRAVAYEAVKAVVFSLPAGPTDKYASIHYAFDLNTGVWSTWSFRSALGCAAVDPSSYMLNLGMADGHIWTERKQFRSADYSDPSFALALPVAAVGTKASTLTFSNANHGLRVGDLLTQIQASNGNKYLAQYVTAVNKAVVTLDSAPPVNWSSDTLTVYPAIVATLGMQPVVGPSPLQAKLFDQHVRLYFSKFDQRFYSVSVNTDEQQVPETITNGRVPSGPGFGVNAFGAEVFGGAGVQNYVSRFTISRAHTRGAELAPVLTIGNANCRFELASIVVAASDSVTDRVVR